VSVLIELLLQAAMEPAEQEALVALAHKRTGTGARTISRQIKNAQREQAKEAAKQAQSQRMAERDDPRPMLEVPEPDAPWLPEMNTVSSVHAGSKDRIPPARGIGTEVAVAFRVDIANLHVFTTEEE
jgi:hypothetical protein